MTIDTETKEKTEDKKKETSPSPADSVSKKTSGSGDSPVRKGRPPFKKNTRKRQTRERVRPEFDQQVISIRRVTRVMAGGRRFSFSVALVAGDRKGRVGVGVGKARDTALAIEKAFRAAKKNMITVPITEDHSIPHMVERKFASTHIWLMPTPGRGMTCGSSLRTVLDLAGIKHVTGKILSRSKNKLNIARAAVRALEDLAEVNTESTTKK